MSVDREQFKLEADHILAEPDLWRIHHFADDALELLSELERWQEFAESNLEAIKRLEGRG